MIVVLAQFFFVARQQRIGGQDDVGAVDLVEQVHALLALQEQHLEARREARGFVEPVGHQAGRGDHQCRAGKTAGLFLGEDVGQRLHRLAETHIVGQDAAQVVLAQELHPGQAVELVVAQGGLQAGRRLDLLHGPELAELAAGFAQALAAGPAQLDAARQFFEARRIEGRQAQLALDLVVEIQLAQGGEDRLETAPRQRHAHAVGQDGQHLVGLGMGGQHGRVEFERRAADQLHQHRQQRHALLRHHDAQLQLEPGIACLAWLVDVGIPVFDRNDVIPVLVRFLQVPAGVGQRVDVVFGKAQPVRLAFELQRAGHGIERGGGRLAEADLAQFIEGVALGLRVAFDDFGDVADLAHHALRRVERDALAVVVEGQHGEVLPARDVAVGQLHGIEQQVRDRLDVIPQALGERLRQWHQLLQAVGQQQLRDAFFIGAGQGRGLRHQGLQFGQRDVDAAAIEFERPAGQVVDVPRRIGRQHVVDLVGRAVGGGATDRLHRPSELGHAAFVAPGQAGQAGRAALQRIHKAAGHVGPRVRPQQLALFEQHLQQDRAHLALGFGGAGALGRPAAHGDEEAHQVDVVAFEIGGGRRQQREHFADRAGRGHVAVRTQARLAQA